jgi:hypothetical protein
MATDLPFPIDRPELELSNLEICFEIAKIKGLNVYEQFGSARIVVAEGDDYYFNPVEDKSLCAELMDEFDVERIYEPYDCLGFHYHCIDDKNPQKVLEIDTSREEVEITMQKAICLAIVRAKPYIGINKKQL